MLKFGNRLFHNIPNLLYWIVPSLLCLALYRLALDTWFLEDDFVWLGQLRLVHGSHDLWIALFQPTIHGTFRPLSERAYFLVLTALFGLDPLPFRICLFVTQFANFVLLCSIVWKITGSRLAGFLAPVLWFVNSDLVIVMSWSSSYMQAMCGFFLLLPFRLLLEYAETGKRRYFWWQWAAFLVGFLVMESEMMYPALAAAYLLFRSRKHLLATLPMFAVSAAYAVAHLVLAKQAAVGAYALHFDAGIFQTLWSYWKLSLVPDGTSHFSKLPGRLAAALVPCLTLGLGAFAAFRIWRRDRLPLIFFSWFVILLVPVLPLKDHVTPYYLTLPLMGIASLGAYAFAMTWTGTIYRRGAAVALLALYLANTVPVTASYLRWRFDRAERAKTIVLGVVTAHRLHPGKTILLTGIDNTLYWSTIPDDPFNAVGVPDVYLAPGTDRGIDTPPGDEGPSKYVLAATTVRSALDKEAIEVYQAGGSRLKNVTRSYARTIALLGDTQPARVDAGVAVQDEQFGRDWYPRDQGFRWMAKHATLKIAGPRSPSEKLRIQGGCVAAELRGGPLHLTVSADGRALGTSEIRDCSQPLVSEYALPPDLVGHGSILLTLDVDRTYLSPADPRPFGLFFGSFEIR
jgi:hypothetical protein